MWFYLFLKAAPIFCWANKWMTNSTHVIYFITSMKWVVCTASPTTSQHTNPYQTRHTAHQSKSTIGLWHWGFIFYTPGFPQTAPGKWNCICHLFFFTVLFLKSHIRIICCDKNRSLCVFLSLAKQHGSKINVSVSLSIVLYYNQNNTLRRFSMSTTTYHTPYCITASSATKEDVVQFASLLRPPSPPFPPPPCPPFASSRTSLLKTDVSQVS